MMEPIDECAGQGAMQASIGLRRERAPHAHTVLLNGVHEPASGSSLIDPLLHAASQLQRPCL